MILSDVSIPEENNDFLLKMLAQRKEKYYYENRHKKSIPMLSC